MNLRDSLANTKVRLLILIFLACPQTWGKAEADKVHKQTLCQQILVNIQNGWRSFVRKPEQLSPSRIIELLQLEPLPGEGGYFRETYRATEIVDTTLASGQILRNRNSSTAIYYMVTANSFSSLHKLPQTEVFHFYMGDPVEMLLISENGEHQIITLGQDLEAGQQPQVVVPPNTWQGTRLKDGFNNFSLLGTTVAPAFEFEDMKLGSRTELVEQFPHLNQLIRLYTHDDEG